MNNTGCILTELAELLCTPEPALWMLLAPEIEENGFLSSWDGVGWDRMGMASCNPAPAWALPVAWTLHSPVQNCVAPFSVSSDL